MEAYCYRICTEDVNRARIEMLVRTRVDCFATYLSWGHWKGWKEDGLTIEYVKAGNKFDLDAEATFLAESIRAMGSQDAVLVYSFPVDMALIESPVSK